MLRIAINRYTTNAGNRVIIETGSYKYSREFTLDLFFRLNFLSHWERIEVRASLTSFLESAEPWPVLTLYELFDSLVLPRAALQK